MAWHRVQIDLGDESVDAMMSADKSQLEVANVIEVGDSIKVDKKTYKVVSSIIPKKFGSCLTSNKFFF